MERIAGEPHTRLRYFCSPQHRDSALYPIIGQIERAAGLAQDDTPRAKLDKVDALLAPSSTSPEDAGLLAEMLSLTNDGRYPILALPPEQRRARTFGALIAQIEALARQTPVLMISSRTRTGATRRAWKRSAERPDSPIAAAPEQPYGSR
jgi:predicted ATPase